MAMRDAGRWVPPTDGEYAEAFLRYRGDTWSTWTIAGGVVVETVCALFLIVTQSSY